MKKVKSERFVFPEADLHFFAGLAKEKIFGHIVRFPGDFCDAS